MRRKAAVVAFGIAAFAAGLTFDLCIGAVQFNQAFRRGASPGMQAIDILRDDAFDFV